VRELQNVIERATIRSRDGQLELGLLRNSSTRISERKSEVKVQPAPDSMDEIKEQEQNLVIDALTKTRGKIYGADGAAALLGMKPTTLSSRIHRLGLKKLVAQRM